MPKSNLPPQESKSRGTGRRQGPGGTPSPASRTSISGRRETDATSFRPVVGNTRRSQAVLTWSVGSIIDLPNGSFMPLGLDFIEEELQHGGVQSSHVYELRFHEDRLEKLLHVRHFQAPCVATEKTKREFGRKVAKGHCVPVVRFPEWLECPQCHRLGTINNPFELDHTRDEVVCQGCGRCKVAPVRFVCACASGHIEDFPWDIWAHRRTKGVCPGGNSRLKLLSRGRSAGLGDLYVTCLACDATADLAKVTMKFSLKDLKTCGGNEPWLRRTVKCQNHLRVLQRGASNLHFAVPASLLSIPPGSDAIAQLLYDQWDSLSQWVDDDELLRRTLEGYKARRGDFDIDVAMQWVKRQHQSEQDDVDSATDETDARFEEYLALSSTHRSDRAGGFTSQFENEVYSPPKELEPWFDLFGAVTRLREVRAIVGFTRISPVTLQIEQVRDAAAHGVISKLGAQWNNWLPGVEIRGEGIFLRFNIESVKSWVAANPAVAQRAALLDKQHVLFYQERLKEAGREETDPVLQITPKHLLVHSFAHVLIRRLSIDCGYSSASLRERLYVDNGAEGASGEMAGVLIYTGSPDSDGSLGGLVNLAQPERLASMIRRAVEDSAWCGNDPVCSETSPMDMGSRLSGASCHSCLLLPETACERFNCELDRAMLCGGVHVEGGQSISFNGYFQQLLEGSAEKGT
ncbi:MAG: DrmB family protein [Candidatus Sumerlaeaceae bacterium]